MTTRQENYRKILLMVFLAVLIFSVFFTNYYLKRMIPSKIHLIVNEEGSFNFNLPFGATIESNDMEVVLGTQSNIPSDQINLTLDQPFQVKSESLGSYQLSLKLFGLFQLKEIEVQVVDEASVFPSGMPVGLYLDTDGVMVVGTGEVADRSGTVSEPAANIIKSGDYILAVNGRAVNSKEELINCINESGGDAMIVGVRRNGEVIEVKLEPVCCGDGEYKAGIWVRDDTQGIGTLTYVDADGNFGALGHGISDSDTAKLIEVNQGTLYQASVNEIIRGSDGSPGSLLGTIIYGKETKYGEIYANTDCGVFGNVEVNTGILTESDAVPIGYRQDVKTGPATILCCVEGQVKEYDINIVQKDMGAQNNKGMIIEVTDEELLSVTGGIVQGMSGSPILQDGKLIGAVTHVFVHDSTRGYGIFIETMMQEQENACKN